MHLVGHVLKLFSRPWGNDFNPLATTKYIKFIKKKRGKFHDIYGLTIVCVKFNNWKLTTSLFLFFMGIVQIYIDRIFVQRTELWLIFKTIWFKWCIYKNTTFHYTVLCFQKSLISTQWDIYTVYLVGSALPTKRYIDFFMESTDIQYLHMSLFSQNELARLCEWVLWKTN